MTFRESRTLQTQHDEELSKHNNWVEPLRLGTAQVYVQLPVAKPGAQSLRLMNGECRLPDTSFASNYHHCRCSSGGVFQ